MKTAAKIFLIIGMIYSGILIFPLIIGIITLKKLESANSVKELTAVGVLSLLFVNLIGGILILCMKDKDLLEDRESASVQNSTEE